MEELIWIYLNEYFSIRIFTMKFIIQIKFKVRYLLYFLVEVKSKLIATIKRREISKLTIISF
jgi:hypothetical protein